MNTGVAALVDLFCVGMSKAESEQLSSEDQRFASLASHYRNRFENEGIALSRDEAEEAYRLVAPLLSVSQNPTVYSRIMVSQLRETGRWALDPYVVETLLREHEDDACFEGKEPWDRYLTHEALFFSVERMQRKERTEALDPDWRTLRDRCRAALERRPVTRPPRGRRDTRIRELSDAVVTAYLQLLDGCGLPVTSQSRNSLARAMADATDFTKGAIGKAWERAGTGIGPFRPYRADMRSRNRDAVLCTSVGCVNPVDRQRIRERLSQICDECEDKLLPW